MSIHTCLDDSGVRDLDLGVLGVRELLRANELSAEAPAALIKPSRLGWKNDKIQF